MNMESLENEDIEFLMNKFQYEKYKNSLSLGFKKNYKKDKKFYKKRTFELTKQLLNHENPDRITTMVLNSFDNYFKDCIEYFKILDKTDIIQEDYIEYNLEEKIINDVSNNLPNILDETIHDTSYNSLLTTHSININQTSLLDNFVTVKNVKLNKMILPKQKKINLKDPILKNKGIKKTNIINNYEEVKISKENKNENETNENNENNEKNEKTEENCKK